MDEKTETEKTQQTKNLQDAMKSNAEKFLAIQRFYKEQHLTEQERARIAEFLASESLYTSPAGETAKAAPTAVRGAQFLKLLKEIFGEGSKR